MSIQSEVDRINSNVASTYTVLSDLGADMPATTNTNNLPATATSVKAVLFGKSQSLTEAQKAQARTNIGAIGASEILEKVTYNTVTNNLNDGVYEYGYFDGPGNDSVLDPVETTFRTKNFLPVESGRRLCFNSSYGAGIVVYIVQYDASRAIVVSRTQLKAEANKWTNNGITLNAATKFVRIVVYKEIADLSTAQFNLFYYENRGEMWTGAGDTFIYVPHYNIHEMGEYVPKSIVQSPLTGKKIVYDGDSIAESAAYNGYGYAKIIADTVGGLYENQAVGGARLTTCPADKSYHSVVDNLPNLPFDGDLYCFEGGINDYWTPKALGTFSKTDYTGTVDTNTICGALETIFRYALINFAGKPICFIITHKIQSTAYIENTNGDTFEDYRNAMVGICQKYSIPYYDAFSESGLNGWNTEQNNKYLTANTNGTADGTHPNEEGYRRFYVPQLIALFERIMPR